MLIFRQVLIRPSLPRPRFGAHADLEARMHAAEHAALVRAVRGFLTGGA
jgi:folate-dependent phosphoribosylglycinamide formyltransferase PurN